MSFAKTVHACGRRLETYGLIAMTAGFVLAVLPVANRELRAFAVFLFLAGVIAGVVGLVDAKLNHPHLTE